MWAQGVPAVIMISREIREFRRHYNTTCDKYDDVFKDIKEILYTRLGLLPQQVVDTIRETLIVEGAVQVTSGDIRRIVSELLEAPGGKMDAITNAISALTQSLTSITAQHVMVNGRTEVQQINNHVVTGDIHAWPGSSQIHTVPHGFVWPSYPANTM